MSIPLLFRASKQPKLDDFETFNAKIIEELGESVHEDSESYSTA